jgi:hypothetical protein
MFREERSQSLPRLPGLRLGARGKITDRFSLGGEIFGQTADNIQDEAATAVGIAAQYDISDGTSSARSIRASWPLGKVISFPTIIALKWIR